MDIEIQFVNLPVIDSDEAFVRQKLSQLQNKYSWITKAAVFFKDEQHGENPGHNSLCEIRLSVPGPQLFASQHETSFGKAAAAVIIQLEIQLKKHKSKLLHH